MAAKMTEALEEFKKTFSRAMFEDFPLSQTDPFDIMSLTVPFDISKYPLKDLQKFGDGSYGTKDFRWPTLEDLKKLNLTEPPRLT